MKILLNPKRHMVDDVPPAAGRSYGSGPVSKWAVVGSLVVLAVGGTLFMLTVEVAVLLTVPLLAAGVLYGVYRAVRSKLHRDQPD